MRTVQRTLFQVRVVEIVSQCHPIQVAVSTEWLVLDLPSGNGVLSGIPAVVEPV